MGLFKKQVKFISAICPECKGHLELDGNLERAFCQYCGAQCIVENVQNPNKCTSNALRSTFISAMSINGGSKLYSVVT